CAGEWLLLGIDYW
nr:immunoglobulin heavy chain junction region [Macaca mulatta]MOV47588.1 immunoglobulin heavy chain junction region [Macaca mulatta]MOV47591.1 immunoglobulin heavy chain junction region [Macaca mulatta]MOV47652.1 immunoglobulin heavy chain junction region [Macaca mulatta]MOV47719.1 immunoglobulin heavy chain junction region [Macaca mulatta]